MRDIEEVTSVMEGAPKPVKASGLTGVFRHTNELISTTNAMRLSERRVLFAALTRLSSKSNSDQVHQQAGWGARVPLSASELAKTYDMTLNAARECLHDGTERLESRKARIYNTNRDRYRRFSWLIESEYSSCGSEYVLWLHPLVIDNSALIRANFTRIKMIEISKLHKKMSWQLYTFVRKYSQFDTDKYLLIDTVYDELAVKPSYQKNRSMFDKQLSEAVSELKEELNISLSYSFVKKGRSLVGMKFTFDMPNTLKEDQGDLFEHEENDAVSEPSAQPLIVPLATDKRESRKRVTEAIMDIKDTDW